MNDAGLPCSIEPSGVTIFVKPLLPLLQQLDTAGYRVPRACRNGVCARCQTCLLAGRVEQDHLTITAPAHILPCRARALEALTIRNEEIRLPGEHPVKELTCSIESVQPLNHDVHGVVLRLPAGSTIGFHAGQYLELITDNDEACAFSIASSPQEVALSRGIQLHLRATADNLTARQLLQQLQQSATVRTVLPRGDCFLPQAVSGTVILLAGSTGYAQTRAVMRDLLDHEHRGEIHFYWGGRTPEDLYSSEPAGWQKQYRNLTYHPVISDAESEARGGLVHESVLEDFSDLSDAIILASGSPAMVYAALDAFEPLGASLQNMYSDVFAYAPRGAR